MNYQVVQFSILKWQGVLEGIRAYFVMSIYRCWACRNKIRYQLLKYFYLGDVTIATGRLTSWVGGVAWALIDCASIIFGIIWQNEHNFWTFYKRSIASIIGIYLVFLPQSWLAWSLRLIVFKLCPWFSLFSFIWGRGKKVTARLHRCSSRGLGTPEVNIPSVPVPAFTGNTGVEQLQDNSCLIARTSWNARDRGAWRKPRANTSDVKNLSLRDRINQFPGQR